uniref:Uncharacterized protein n=1 Tax=Timema tahoe TaxID=61484 RepID=A0A7R9FJC0_9NEOP|nr:unnamed protein product [Timema tahoe]
MLRKGGFCHNDGEEQNEAVEEIVPTVDSWEDVGHDVGVHYEDFMNLDENLAMCGEPIDESSDEKGEQTEIPEKPIPTSTQAMVHIGELRQFVEEQHNVSHPIPQALNKLEDVGYKLIPDFMDFYYALGMAIGDRLIFKKTSKNNTWETTRVYA